MTVTVVVVLVLVFTILTILIFRHVFRSENSRNSGFRFSGPLKGGPETGNGKPFRKMAGRIRRLFSPRWRHSFWLCLQFRLRHGRGCFDKSPPKFALAQQPEEQDPHVSAEEVVQLAPSYHKDAGAKAMIQAWLFTRRQ